MAYKYQKLLDKLRQDEGFEPEPYRDHLGKLTIGIGWLLPPEEGGEELPPGYAPPLTEQQGVELARYKINQKVAGLARIDTFNTLDPMRQEILVECAYQIGVAGLAKFKRMWAALADGNYLEAAKEMLDSKVAREQTPKRWEDHAKRMVGGPVRGVERALGLAESAQAEAAQLDALAAAAAKEDASMRFKPPPTTQTTGDPPLERVEGTVLGDEEYSGDSIEARAHACYEAWKALGLTRTHKQWEELTGETRSRWVIAVSGHLLTNKA